MLMAVDTKTGEKMTDDSIVDNVWFKFDDDRNFLTLRLVIFAVDYIPHCRS